jgi:Cyclic nucleotide-binding domain
MAFRNVAPECTTDEEDDFVFDQTHSSSPSVSPNRRPSNHHHLARPKSADLRHLMQPSGVVRVQLHGLLGANSPISPLSPDVLRGVTPTTITDCKSARAARHSPDLRKRTRQLGCSPSTSNSSSTKTSPRRPRIRGRNRYAASAASTPRDGGMLQTEHVVVRSKRASPVPLEQSDVGSFDFRLLPFRRHLPQDGTRSAGHTADSYSPTSSGMAVDMVDRLTLSPNSTDDRHTAADMADSSIHDSSTNAQSSAISMSHHPAVPNMNLQWGSSAIPLRSHGRQNLMTPRSPVKSSSAQGLVLDSRSKKRRRRNAIVGGSTSEAGNPDSFHNMIRHLSIQDDMDPESKRALMNTMFMTHPILKTLSPSCRKLVEAEFVVERFRKEQYIIRRGETRDKFYFVYAGMCLAYANSADNPGSMSRFPGDTFGDLSLIGPPPPSPFTVVAPGDAAALCIDGSIYRYIVQHHNQEQFARLTTFIQNDMKFLRFKEKSEMCQFLDGCEVHHFSQSDVVMHPSSSMVQGTSSSEPCVFVTLSGSLQLTRPDGKSRSLSKGDWFGIEMLDTKVQHVAPPSIRYKITCDSAACSVLAVSASILEALPHIRACVLDRHFMGRI